MSISENTWHLRNTSETSVGLAYHAPGPGSCAGPPASSHLYGSSEIAFKTAFTCCKSRSKPPCAIRAPRPEVGVRRLTRNEPRSPVPLTPDRKVLTFVRRSDQGIPSKRHAAQFKPVLGLHPLGNSAQRAAHARGVSLKISGIQVVRIPWRK
jgi:hypothetical protein